MQPRPMTQDDVKQLQGYVASLTGIAGQIAGMIAVAVGTEAAASSVPTLLADDGSNPKYDPGTGLIVEDFYRYGRMGAQKGARYSDWSKAWQIYSMMGWGGPETPMHAWVEVAPDPAHPENDHPTQNARHAWELGWMEAPPADPAGDAERQATWDAWKARVLARRGQ